MGKSHHPHHKLSSPAGDLILRPHLSLALFLSLCVSVSVELIHFDFKDIQWLDKNIPLLL